MEVKITKFYESDGKYFPLTNCKGKIKGLISCRRYLKTLARLKKEYYGATLYEKETELKNSVFGRDYVLKIGKVIVPFPGSFLLVLGGKWNGWLAVKINPITIGKVDNKKTSQNRRKEKLNKLKQDKE